MNEYTLTITGTCVETGQGVSYWIKVRAADAQTAAEALASALADVTSGKHVIVLDSGAELYGP